MAEESINIDGKDYISSARAASLIGYTKDYVGQLARAGKIDCKRIGRSWYIAEESIRKHKLSVHYELTKPKKSQKRDIETANKTSKNIAFSPKEDNPKEVVEEQTADTLNQVSEISSTSSTHEEETSDENEFIPKLQKKSDALTAADIHYEKVHPPRYEENARSNEKNNVVRFNNVPVDTVAKKSPVRHLDTDTTTIRKQNDKLLRPKPSPRGVAVDGVISADERPIKRRNPRIQKPVAEEIFDPHAKENRMHFNDHKNVEARSKAVPVIGAIIIFTVVVVVYIFISAD